VAPLFAIPPFALSGRNLLTLFHEGELVETRVALLYDKAFAFAIKVKSNDANMGATAFWTVLVQGLPLCGSCFWRQRTMKRILQRPQ